MEEVIIEIPGRKIKMRARNISEAITELNKLKEEEQLNKKPSSIKEVSAEYFGIFKAKQGYNYKEHEADWYKQ